MVFLLISYLLPAPPSAASVAHLTAGGATPLGIVVSQRRLGLLWISYGVPTDFLSTPSAALGRLCGPPDGWGGLPH